MADQTQISFQSLTDAIGQCKTDLISRFDASTNSTEMALRDVNTKLEMLGDQIITVQQRVICNKDNIEDFKVCINNTEKENGYLKEKVEVMENYSR